MRPVCFKTFVVRLFFMCAGLSSSTHTEPLANKVGSTPFTTEPGVPKAEPAAVKKERVTVKYGGEVDLALLECKTVTRSSFIRRLCYDKREEYVIVKLNDTYYHYCEVPQEVIDGWRQAESMGRYYNANVRSRFDCRVLRVPPYASDQ